MFYKPTETKVRICTQNRNTISRFIDSLLNKYIINVCTELIGLENNKSEPSFSKCIHKKQ